ncbi:MAG: filamentous hemagglutinin N-terminal domain-containing protein, partial [Gammaproteobacteria bacterium]
MATPSRTSRVARRGLVALLAALPALPASAAGPTGLPVPCSPCNLGGASVPWTNPAGLSARQLAPQTGNGGRDMVIYQGRERQVYSWESFDIGAGRSVEFRQPNSRSAALNRVLDTQGSGLASVIEGTLRANGQVYLINRNGVLFKRGASVDVNTLLASTLDLNQDVDNLFEEVGIGNVLSERITQGQFAALVDEAAGLPGNVVVEQGAVIEAGRNGRIVLVGANVENSGVLRLSGPGGQALLVAGSDRVYFFDDSGARGLGVEIGGDGGTVANLGQIIAGNGNVTLAGLTVNQQGVVRATNAVSANGTIRLQARDRAFADPTLRPDDVDALALRIDNEQIATRSGTVRFGADSVTEILPDADSTDVVVDEQAFLPARVEVRGQDIVMERNARITVPAGDVEFIASERPELGNATLIGVDPVETGSIVLERGATIDVSGVDGVEIPASRNVLQLQLRRGELAASPINRDGPLLGTTLSFDLRDPPAFVDVSGAVDAIGRGILERSTPGGSIRLYSADALRLAPGALLDASGGGIDYTAASAVITRVLVGNRILDLGEVGASTRIDAVLGAREAVHPRWGYTSVLASSALLGAVDLPAYFEGKDAGTIEIAALNAVRQATEASLAQLQLDAELEGRIVATARRGRYQVETPSPGARGFARDFDEVPLGGALSLALRAGDYRLGEGALVDGDGRRLTLEGLRSLAFDVGSFGVATGDAVTLGGGGVLTVTTHTGGAAIAGAISAPGGVVSVEVATPQADLELSAGAVLDVAGVWVNDAVADSDDSNAPMPAFVDGGTVALRGVDGGALHIAAGSRVDVGGGARLGEGGDLVPGDGGRFELVDGVSALATAADIVLDGTITGYVFAGATAGARYDLAVRSATLAPGAAIRSDAAGLVLGPGFFTNGGFTEFSVRSTQTGTAVAAGFDLDLVPRYRVLTPDVARANLAAAASGAAAPSGASLDDLSIVSVVDDPLLRVPTSLSLESVRPVAQISSRIGDTTPIAPSLRIEAGARIAVDVGGSLRFAASGAIAHAGTLSARGGEVRVELLADAFGDSPGFDRARAIWLLDDSLIDVSGIVLDTARDPLTGQVTRQALDGGDIVLRTGVAASGAAAKTGGGFIVAYPRAILDVAGADGVTDVLRASGGAVPRLAAEPIASDAGRITLEASHGIEFFARVDAGARRDLGAVGGTLALTLDSDRYQENELLDAGLVPFPVIDAARIEIAADARIAAGASLEPLDTARFGVARFDLAAYRAAGFDALELRAQPDIERIEPGTAAPLGVLVPRIDLLGTVTFDAGDRLVLDAPVLQSDGSRALLMADYVRLGHADESNTLRPSDVASGTGFSAAGGSGSLVVDAGYIDFTGVVGLRGFGGSNVDGSAASGIVAFLSDSDIRFNGMLLPRSGTALRSVGGRVAAAGDLLFRADRLYVSTLTDFTIDNTGAGAITSFVDGSRGAAFLHERHAPLPAAVDALLASRLAAPAGNEAIPNAGGGSLTVRSDVINQAGRLYAPFGALTLDAERHLLLDSGSLTSVSGFDTSTLFGETSLGEWIFSFSGSGFQDFTLVVEPGADDPFAIDLPAKSIRLIADGTDGGNAAGFVDLRRGAVLDVRGGGELVASEFVIGPTGKIDLLQAGLDDGSFALMPMLGDTIALFDPLETRAFGFDATTQVAVLDGAASGIEAGRYAVLPRRYALLPGAFLLTPESADSGSILGAATSATSSDGVPLVSAALTRFGQDSVAALDARQYRVETAADIQRRAEYRVTTANDFFPRQAADADRVAPLLPRDAGAVQILPNFRLNLGAEVAQGGAAGGASSRVDISAEKVLLADSTRVANPDGAVVLLADGLRGLGAGSLLIGGTRRAEGSRVVVEDVSAERVSVDGAVNLTLPGGLTLAARERIDLAAGSRLGARAA